MHVADQPDDMLTAKTQCCLQLDLCMSRVSIVGLQSQVPSTPCNGGFAFWLLELTIDI